MNIVHLFVLFKYNLFIANLRQCLLEGYPCIHSQTAPDSSVSICCSGKKCQNVSNNSENQFTCQGDPSGDYFSLSILIEYLPLF